MTEYDDEYTLTFRDITPLEYILLTTALEDTHESVHKAEALGHADEEDVEAVHSLLDTVNDAPESLVEEANDLAEQTVEELLDGEEGNDTPGNIEELEEMVAEATGADAVTTIPASEIPGVEVNEDGDDSDDSDRMFQ